jgi:hypothetical protein
MSSVITTPPPRYIASNFGTSAGALGFCCANMMFAITLKRCYGTYGCGISHVQMLRAETSYIGFVGRAGPLWYKASSQPSMWHPPITSYLWLPNSLMIDFCQWCPLTSTAHGTVCAGFFPHVYQTALILNGLCMHTCCRHLSN